MAFTTDPKARKAAPVFSGVLKYFPDAIFEVAELSQRGNDQHNPGEPLHWAKGKSQDELDACVRHLMEAPARDTDGVRHAAKAAWRALANLQKEIEAEREGITVEELNRRYKTEALANEPLVGIPKAVDYTKGPCIEIEDGKGYRVVARRYSMGYLAVGNEFTAGLGDVGHGLDDQGFRYIRNTWVKVAPC